MSIDDWKKEQDEKAKVAKPPKPPERPKKDERKDIPKLPEQPEPQATDTPHQDAIDDDNDVVTRGGMTLNNGRAVRLELIQADETSTTLPYIHIGIIEYDGKNTIIFNAMSLIITIKGTNIKQVIRGLRLEKLQILKVGNPKEQRNPNNVFIEKISIMDTKHAP